MARPDMGVPDLDYPAHYRGSPCPGHGMVWSTSTWSDGCRQAYSLFSRTVGKRSPLFGMQACCRAFCSRNRRVLKRLGGGTSRMLY